MLAAIYVPKIPDKPQNELTIMNLGFVEAFYWAASHKSISRSPQRGICQSKGV